jgi:hypothetical protein
MVNYILLYSKYSRSCMRLLDTVDQLSDLLNINLVCIDNKEIRKRICGSKSFEITKVPCLLISDDSTVEKYDGEKVFLWINEVFEKLKGNQGQVHVQNQVPVLNTPVSGRDVEYVDNNEKKNVSSINMDEEKVNKKVIRKKVSKVNMTRIEDLDDMGEEDKQGDEENEEENEEENKNIKRPPIPIRNGAGNYTFESELESEPSISNYTSKNKKKKSGGEGEKANILEMAMAMRKEREKENK